MISGAQVKIKNTVEIRVSLDFNMLITWVEMVQTCNIVVIVVAE